MADDFDDLDLNTLNDEELTEQVHDDLYNGLREEVQGLGVVGQQPLLRPGEAFEYTSGSRLRTASGTMHGNYFCVAEDGTRFEVEIPLFVLEAAPGAAPPRTVH